MADRNNEKLAERESAALGKLQAAVGLVDKPQAERLDWMYEQSALTKTDDLELMNKPVAAQKDKDMEDMKKLQESTAGSLFLKSATKTTEDMLRKIREDPMFQIKRQEQAARENLLANPLVQARLKQKVMKQSKKESKKAKKAAKKEKKAAKKAKKAAKKAKKAAKGSSSSSDSSGSSASAPDEAPATGSRPSRLASPVRPPSRSRAPRDKDGEPDLRGLGPSSLMVDKRAEYAQSLADRKSQALASRGLPQRLTEEDKKRRLAQMRADADSHEREKDHKIAAAERHDKEQEELEARMRSTSDQKYFREMREKAYTESGSTVADRLKNQRHRRQKHLNDPLERDG